MSPLFPATSQPIFKAPLCRAGAWCWIIYNAPCETSVRDLARVWGWTAPKVQRFLKWLTDNAWADTHATKDGTRITLGKSAPLPAHALGHRERTDTPALHLPTQADEPFSPDATGDLFGSPAPGKGKRLAANWVLPKTWGDWALDQGMARPDVVKEASIFRDYWIAQPGQKGVKRDWAATWRNWIKRKVDDRRPAQPEGESLTAKLLRERG